MSRLKITNNNGVLAKEVVVLRSKDMCCFYDHIKYILERGDSMKMCW